MKKALRLVTNIDQGKRLVADLLSRSPRELVGLDCEGVRLGRFGKLSLMQLSEESGGTISIIDAKIDGMIESFRPLLESEDVLKVMHDSREDSSALYHQFQAKLRGVIDTQVASLLIQKDVGKQQRLIQESYADLSSRYCGFQATDGLEMKQKMLEDPFLWHKRPLTKEFVDYAVNGVEYLIPIWRAMSHLVSIDSVLHSSEAWVSYREMNQKLEQPNMVEQIGTPLLGMVAAITDKGVFFKLNIGRTGVCSTPSALKRMLLGTGHFPPVQVGDTVELAVSGISIDGKTIYVDRRDPDWEFFDFFRRPDPKKMDSPGQEYRHIPSLVDGGTSIDPLLRRGLGSYGEIDSDSDDEVDHEPILTHKPHRK